MSDDYPFLLADAHLVAAADIRHPPISGVGDEAFTAVRRANLPDPEVRVPNVRPRGPHVEEIAVLRLGGGQVVDDRLVLVVFVAARESEQLIHGDLTFYLLWRCMRCTVAR